MIAAGAIGRIAEIQATLQQLSGQATRATASDAEFSRSLAAVQGSSAVSSAGASLGASTATPSGADVVAAAKNYLGVPYVFGGEDATGMDCSGLVQRVYADLGISLPRVVPDQAAVGTEVASLAEAQPGDLIVAKGSGHILIYAGDNKVIHAPRPGTEVALVDNWRSDADIETIRRIVPAAVEAPTVAAPSFDASWLSGALGGATGTTATGVQPETLQPILMAARMSFLSGQSL